MNIMNVNKNKSGYKTSVFNGITCLLVVIILVSFVNINSVFASTKTGQVVKKTVSAKSVSKKKPVKVSKGASKTTLQWTKDGLKALGSPASFGYNYAIRNAIIKKIENYARRKNIKTVTAAVVNSMNE